MDGELTQFADSLAPSEEFFRRGNEVMDRLFRTLQADGIYSIDRLRLAGSLQKKTALRFCPDYDVVAFLNHVTPNDDVLKHFKTVIRKKFHIGKKKIKISLRSLQFNLNGVEFDLLFARNMVKANSKDPTVAQHSAMLRSVKSSANPFKDAFVGSAGFTEAAVDFVKQQSSFVHKVARLAKYWNSTIFFPGRISARSSIFELIGITAGREEEENNPRNPSIGVAFKRFLQKVATLKSQRIMYYEFYGPNDVPLKVLNKTPLILDPSSPYNNFMFGFNRKAMELFSTCAKESLEKCKTDISGSLHMHEGKCTTIS